MLGSKQPARIRFVVDTNIWISALLYGGEPERALRHLLSRQRIIISEYILDEVFRTLKSYKPRLAQKWLRSLRLQMTEYVHDDLYDHQEKIRDIKDEPVVRLAVKHDAVIVTGDKDILEYIGITGLQAVSVAEYCELFIKSD